MMVIGISVPKELLVFLVCSSQSPSIMLAQIMDLTSIQFHIRGKHAQKYIPSPLTILPTRCTIISSAQEKRKITKRAARVKHGEMWQEYCNYIMLIMTECLEKVYKNQLETSVSSQFPSFLAQDLAWSLSLFVGLFTRKLEHVYNFIRTPCYFYEN